jgi:hypothetical protein
MYNICRQNIRILNIDDHIAKQFQIINEKDLCNIKLIKQIGEGAFGKVS